MWTPKTQPLTNVDGALIAYDYEDLLYDDGPVLFVGRNSLGDPVVGSLIDYGKGFVAYFHSVVPESVFADFRQRVISYPELMRLASSLYVLRWGAGVEPTVYPVHFVDIPKSYKPDEQAFYPRYCTPSLSKEHS
jgi:hypothetical protein